MLSSDELCLAVLAGDGQISCYSLPALMHPDPPKPHTQPLGIQTPDGARISLFVWCKGHSSAAQVSSFLYVTECGDLFMDRLDRPEHAHTRTLVASGVIAADWAPDGLSLVYSTHTDTDSSIWLVPAMSEAANPIHSHQSTITHPECGSLVIDSICWVSAATLLLVGVGTGGEEEAYMSALQLEGWVPALGDSLPPPSVVVAAYIPFSITGSRNASAANHLHTSTFRQWGATLIAHSSANDDHIQLLVGGRHASSATNTLPHLVSVTDDRMNIRLPNAPDGQDNYVVGLDLDLSIGSVRLWGGGTRHGRSV